MNTFIVSMVTFAVGLVLGAMFLAVCNTKAFDENGERFGDTYMNRMQQMEQTRQFEQRLQQQEQRQRNPCQ